MEGVNFIIIVLLVLIPFSCFYFSSCYFHLLFSCLALFPFHCSLYCIIAFIAVTIANKCQQQQSYFLLALEV